MYQILSNKDILRNHISSRVIATDDLLDVSREDVLKEDRDGFYIVSGGRRHSITRGWYVRITYRNLHTRTMRRWYNIDFD